MDKEKSQVELLQQKLCSKNENTAQLISDADLKKADEFCEGYKDFLKTCKTERECVKFAIEKATAKGFTEFNPAKSYKSGDKVYYNNRNKAIILAVIGEKSIEKGVKIVASHIDSPRCLALASSKYFVDFFL